MTAPNQIMWAFIGLLLTIGGTFLNAYITSSPLSWDSSGVQTFSLGITYQIGAVLLTGCVGGKNAGAISQIAYLLLGLTWLPVFAQGGGVDYLKQPYFGYVLGFIPGAWACGLLAFKTQPKIESLAFSCVFGLAAIHITGLSYLIVIHAFNWINSQLSLLQLAIQYSLSPLPGQLVIVCAVTVLAYGLRHLMFY
ncbi:biotin transporter BioY [Synechocystis sp. PCC 7509]|uniref:biotin transporter BioY n=1 Tax=Synechocystis sp. PCC 7509 TaxID=927677 RepID=UPI0003189229|nr:biotin transporter BioY [Synechocystis sp. PCC 7509]